jgi:F0F1-type ATP synthase membrane subunit b/b'
MKIIGSIIQSSFITMVVRKVMKNHIQDVLEIERRAQEIHDSAATEAEKLPKAAEQEAQNLLEKARKEAEKEANHLIEKANSQDDVEHILEEAGEKVDHMKTLAMSHFDRAVGYVLDQIAGRE